MLLVPLLSACGKPESPGQANAEAWTEAERKLIESLWIGQLGTPPPSPGNPVADDPAAADFGRKLFFDPRLSRNGKIACATCHQPERFFTDGKPTAEGLGKLRRNVPGLVGSAWSPWLFWDGHTDSLWSQALLPLEHPDEMGLTRRVLAAFIAQHYLPEYLALFGPLPQGAAEDRGQAQILVNIGRALEAFERTLRPMPTRFDRYAAALRDNDHASLSALSGQEQRGLKLFLGKAQCVRCHNGPLFTNQGFHNTGLAPLKGAAFDPGRAAGVAQALESAFNCRSLYSAAADKSCPQLQFARSSGPELVGAFKTPGLRGVAETAPYMHDGRFATLAEVLAHYQRAPGINPAFGHSELFPLDLSEQELASLEAFLRSLSGSFLNIH